MLRGDASPAVSVERFFEFSLLGLIASAYLAVAGSGYLDTPTVLLVGLALLVRGFAIAGTIRVDISDRAGMWITVAYGAFYVLDYFLISREFLTATVHLVFFLAVMKVLTAKTSRDHLYTAMISFVELLAAAMLSINFNFFLFLALYLLFAMAALTSAEIRRGLHKAAATARGRTRWFHARLAALSVSITFGILAMTAGLFLMLPRTADAALSRLISHRIHVPGFSNEVTLGEIGAIKTTSRPMMHIQVFSRELWSGLKWRGATLTDFDGKRWSNPGNSRWPVAIENGQAELDAPDNRPHGVSYQVEYDELETDALFFAGTPQKIYLRRGSLYRTETGAYRLLEPAGQGFRYEAYSLAEEPPEFAPVRVPTPVLPLAARERYLQLPALDPRVPRLAREMAGGGSDLERARGIERRLRTEFGYTLQLPSHEVADPLAYFLFTRKKGHCEYFASAMAVMLRTLGIPSRLATGFQTGVYNPISDLWVVRASDAHSWVEGWIPGRGWTTFDPTPADPGAGQFPLLAKLGLYLDAAETYWQQWVVGYDSGTQGSLLDRLEQGARRVGIGWFDSLNGMEGLDDRAGKWFRKFGVWLLASVVAGVWVWLIAPPLVRVIRLRHRVGRVRRGQASVADATLLYQRMLQIVKRHGYQKPPWFTPAEFAASLPREGVGAAVLEFTTTYNAVRFGGHTQAAPQLSILLDHLERRGRRS